MTKEKVLEALSTVQEPDLGKDIVTLNMVKDIVIEKYYVSFTVVLTTPACPLKEMIEKACVNAIRMGGELHRSQPSVRSFNRRSHEGAGGG